MIRAEITWKPGRCPHREGNKSVFVDPNIDSAFLLPLRRFVDTGEHLLLVMGAEFFPLRLGDTERLEIWVE